MDLIRLRYLFNRYKAKRLTDSEREEWEGMVLDAAYTKAIEALMQEEWEEANSVGTGSGDNDTRMEQIFRHIVNQRQTRSYRPRILQPRPDTAHVPALVTIGMWLAPHFSADRATVDQQPRMAKAADPIEPGTNKAILTLPGGKRVDLSANHEGIVVAEGAINYLNGDPVIEPAE